VVKFRFIEMCQMTAWGALFSNFQRFNLFNPRCDVPGAATKNGFV